MVMLMLNGEWAVVSTLAGGLNGSNVAFADASGTNAGFNHPYGVAVDANGNVFVADMYNQRIRKVTAVVGTFLREGYFDALFRLYAVLSLSGMFACVSFRVYLFCMFVCVTVCRSLDLLAHLCVVAVGGCVFVLGLGLLFRRVSLSRVVSDYQTQGSVFVFMHHCSARACRLHSIHIALACDPSCWCVMVWHSSDCVCALSLQGYRVVPATPTAP